MGWFDDERTKREKAQLKKYKKKPYSRKAKKSVSKATKRQRELEKLQAKTGVYEDELRVRKAKQALKKKKAQAEAGRWYKKEISLPKKKKVATGRKGKKTAPVGSFFGVPVKKKKQGRPLSRKRAIRLL